MVAPYCGPASVPQDWASRWNLDPILLAVFVLIGLLVLARSRGGSRLAALSTLAIAALIFISPLCALSSALFSARTVHHVLLIAVIAPLAALTLPTRRMGSLALATVVQAVVFWSWHAPAAYQSALSSDAVYWAMQITLFASALWFWATVRASSMPAGVLGLLAAMIAMGLLGALITFAPSALYGPHLTTTQAWGMTPLEDQQAAGLIMWAPAAALYLAAALLRLGCWIGPDRPGALAT